MLDIFPIAKPLLHALAPETAHNVAICALKNNLVPAVKIETHQTLTQKIFGLEFKNPVGLAAGFDKNAVAINSLLRQGFGFVEMGTVTPLPQSGNPKPRIFRLSEDKAIINRLGFNNLGLEAFVKNFKARNKNLGIAGANIGKNKDTVDASSDYILGLKAVYEFADYITINISSPNTKGLRDLQEKEALASLLSAITNEREKLTKIHSRRVPLLLKIAPDIAGEELEDIAETIIKYGIDGLIVSNTTISRPETLSSEYKAETGGLSGAPLFALSTQVLSDIYKITGGKIPIIGVGGIASAEDAYAKIRAGASLVQVYSALIYQGFRVIREINQKLPELLKRDGFSFINEAVGCSTN